MSGGELRVAVVGYGLAGSVFHAPLVAATPGMRVAAIVTGNSERRKKAVRDHPEAVLHDTAEAITAADCDLVVVAAANRAHAPLAIAALEAGLPVVVDKPMAATVAHAEAMIEAAQQAGLLLTVFQNRRWDAEFLTAQRLIEQGALGRVTRLESRFERFRPRPKAGWRELGDPADAGGVLFDLGSHLVDQACVLFGNPTHVYAEIAMLRETAHVDDHAFLALRFGDDGPVAHLSMSQVAPIPGPRLRISGLSGAYEHHDLDPQEDQLRAGLRPGDPGFGEEPADRHGWLITPDEERRHPTVPGAWRAFYSGVRDALAGGAPPVDPADGLRVLRLIDAARTSAREARVVRL